MNKATPTAKYYFAMSGKIYFGDVDNYRLYHDMCRHPYSEVEAEADRLNKRAGYVMPVDDDYCEGDE